jgi:hypothetical protein
MRKSIQLLIITLAAIVPDFDSGIGLLFSVFSSSACQSLHPGIASIFALAKQYHTTPGVINDSTSKSVHSHLVPDIA